MGKEIVIIGAGVVGVCTAYYLHKAGHRVRIIEKNGQDKGCSYGNAGMVVPSHFIPLAAPGVMSKGLKWMLDQESPFYIKPRLNQHLLKWMWQFYKNANTEHVEISAPFLKELNSFSQACYEEIRQEGNIAFHYEQKGLLMLCQTEKSAQEERAICGNARALGIEANWYGKDDLKTLEPDVAINAIGGLHFPGDSHLTPSEFMKGMIAFLQSAGVVFNWNTEVQSFNIDDNSIKGVQTNNGTFESDETLIAAGAWSAELLKKINTQILLQGGKGYSFETFDTKIRIPSILTDAKVAVTPMNGYTRFAGTMEINGTNESINARRVNGIVKSISRYYPDIQPDIDKKNVWQGLRPCSPDGLPYLGRHNDIQNLTVATGHAMMGMSLGPGTGKIMAEIVENKITSVDLSLCDLHRFE